MFDKEKDSLFTGQFESGYYEGLGRFLPNRALPDYRQDGHFERDLLNGFAIVTKKGGQGFTGVYRNDEPLEGYKKLRPSKN